MFYKIVNIAFVCLVGFCALWLLAADGAKDSLRDSLDAEKAKRDVLSSQRNDLERALVRTRVQLNSLIDANSELIQKMDELQKQIKAQELEILQLQKTAPQSLRKSKRRIDSINTRFSEVKSVLKSSKLQGETQLDSILSMVEYSKLLSERVD